MSAGRVHAPETPSSFGSMAISIEFFRQVEGRDRYRAARRRLFRGVEKGRGVWEGCVIGMGDDASGVVVVEDEERASPTPRMIGPASRPVFRAMAPSPSRASDSDREADMPNFSCKYIARIMVEISLKVSERFDPRQALSRARCGTSKEY